MNQSDIDAAVERLRLNDYGDEGTEGPSAEQREIDHTILSAAYVALRDPAPITPEGLASEGYLIRTDENCWQDKKQRLFLSRQEGTDQFYAHWRFGSMFAFSMGGVRLAMLLAGGER